MTDKQTNDPINQCHNKDPNKAMMIVERKSPTWNDMTCLHIAASSNDQVCKLFTTVKLYDWIIAASSYQAALLRR